ncbi:nucleolar complex protein 2, partial [Lecanoromycetidae sp. Uapishka_2]
MPGRAKKSTKKFEKNHLKDAIEKRKEGAKIKQRQQTKVKKQKRNAADKAKVSDDEANSSMPVVKASGATASADLSKMSVDEFFQGGFQLPEQKKKPKNTGEPKEIPQRIGKRKRDTGDESDSSVLEGISPAISDEETHSDEEDGLGMHKKDLDTLAEKDPDFYKYLQENDAELLDFNEDADPAGLDQLSEEEEKVRRKPKKSKAREEESDDQTEEESSDVTMAMVTKWKAAMSEQHSLRTMRQVVLAFRAAAHINSEDGKEHKYTISSPEVYHELLVTALEHVPKILSHHLPIKEFPTGKVRVPTDSKKFRTLSPLLKSYSASLHHLMENISDAPVLKLTISSLVPLLPYLLSFKKVLKTLIKTAVDIWSDTSSNEVTRISAFFVIRRLAVISDASLREAVLKTAYQGLVKGSRITNIHTLPGINLMKNSAAELWGLDPNIGYTTGFTYIRQLAVHLRTCITHPTKDSYKTIYNWQYTHSLDLWSRVLSTQCSPLTNPALKTPSASPLHPLIYPLVQISLGALRLIPTPAYFPLRFHLTRTLLRISRTTNTYIPLAPALLEVLTSSDLSKPPKPSTLPPLDFSIVLRAPKTYLRTRVYQDGLGQQVQELLAEFFGCWAKHIAFPELTIPPTVALKRWLKSASSVPSRGNKEAITKADRGGKGNKNAKLNSSMSLLLQKLSANAHYIETRRSHVSFGPSDRAGVEGFLRDVPVEETPLGAFVAGMRKQNEEKERMVEQGRKEEEARKAREDRGRKGKGGDSEKGLDAEDVEDGDSDVDENSE